MDEISDLRQVVNKVVSGMNLENSQRAFTVLDGWKKVLLRIKSNTNPNEGQKLTEHTRVIDLKNGILLVEVDHPGWMSLLQFHKNYILRGLNLDMPNLKIKNIGFTLKKQNDDFENNSFSEKEAVSNVQKRIEEEEKTVNSLLKKENFPEITKNKELPQELQSLFAELKADMLTNQEK